MGENGKKDDAELAEMILKGPELLERTGRGETLTQTERSAAVLYVALKLAALVCNDARKGAKEAAAHRERLESLKDYFDASEALRLARHSQTTPVPPQYFLAALYVVAEGFKKLRLRDTKISGLLKSPHLGLLKRFRNAVFHYQRARVNEKLLGFLSKDCLEWVKELHSELQRWFAETVKSRDGTVETLLGWVRKLFPEQQAQEFVIRIRSEIAASMSLTIEDFDSQYETLKTTPLSVPEAERILLAAFPKDKDSVWPMVEALVAALRKPVNTPEDIDIDAIIGEARHAEPEP